MTDTTSIPLLVLSLYKYMTLYMYIYITLSCILPFMQSQGLEFQVWSKTIEPQQENYVGSAHVDLCPLSFGLSHICGWYNIMDFSGQTQGQLKVRKFTEFLNHKDFFLL